jgi:hypothetical protein
LVVPCMEYNMYFSLTIWYSNVLQCQCF